MFWLWIGKLLLLAFIVFIFVQLVRLYLADGDLTLMWAEKYGKPISNLSGNVIWITGASSGIGEYLAYELARAGCRLVLSARRQKELERVKKQCVLSGRLQDKDVLVLPFDMLQYNRHAECVNTVIDHFGTIDVLVNNAGRSQRAEWDKINIQVDREMFELDVLSGLSLTRAVLPHMVARKRGQIVINSSIAGKMGAPMSASYTGAKHALVGYYECLRSEFGGRGIDVTTVCPGPTFSSFLENSFTDTPGQVHGVKQQANEKRLLTSRVGYLMAVAIANKLDEVWISLHPILLLVYISQYFPSISKRVSKSLGSKMFMKMREGK